MRAEPIFATYRKNGPPVVTVSNESPTSYAFAQFSRSVQRPRDPPLHRESNAREETLSADSLSDVRVWRDRQSSPYLRDLVLVYRATLHYELHFLQNADVL